MPSQDALRALAYKFAEEEIKQADVQRSKKRAKLDANALAEVLGATTA
jgi:hypothetical protein